jgi:hypothetical protein
MSVFNNKPAIRYLFLFSLILLSFKVLLDLIIAVSFIDVVDSFAISLNFFLVFISLGQIFGILKNHKLTWLLSALQVIMVYYMSQGSFSWFFSYILRPLVTLQVTHTYILTLCLFGSEIAKSVWLYRHNK